MLNQANRSPTPLLDPIDRISEVLFGLIMVLTFTGSLSVAEAGREEVRTMLIGAVGCNFAWGVIDATFFLMGILAEDWRAAASFHAVRAAPDPQRAQRLIAAALPPLLASVVGPAELTALHQRLNQLPEPPRRPRLKRDDWLRAGAVFLLVFLSTFPVVIPFLVMRDALPALRVSNAVAVLMLFILGFAYGRMIGRRPWLAGISMVILGGVLVVLTMALGG